MPPVNSSRYTKVSASIPSCLGITLNASDIALTRELIRYAIESLHDVIIIAERRNAPIARAIERYRDDAVALLERMRAT